MKETELKLKLSKEDYRKLSEFLNPFNDETQSEVYWNLYYDTPGSGLKRGGASLRIRIVEREQEWTRVIATLKTNKVRQEYLSVCDEYEVDITSRVKREEFLCTYAFVYSAEQIGNIWDMIEPITYGHAVCLIGGLKVRRDRYNYQGQEIELDRVWFSKDVCDYELEVETEDVDVTTQIIKELLEQLNIDMRPSPKTKRGRFTKFTKMHGRQVLFKW